ncbi:hypothetical protein SLE2022_367540 [Rubroshorea leprosula]
MDGEEEKEEKSVVVADDRAWNGMDLLPLDTLIAILSRLPITSLIQFKRTSHAGRDLIAHPHLIQAFHNWVSDSNPCLIFFGDHSQLYFLGCDYPKIYSRTALRFERTFYSSLSDMVGCCNGLLCVSCHLNSGESAIRSLEIYNPFVGDPVAIRPEPANRFSNLREVFGFGFHPITRDYKVVRILYYAKLLKLEGRAICGVAEKAFQVFTLGTGEWRDKENIPKGLELRPPEALVEGSLHWVVVADEGLYYAIVSFQLADEVFEEIPHPPCQSLVSSRYSLSVLNGCLSAAGLGETAQFDIWVMKQYKVEDSWKKEYSFVPNVPLGLTMRRGSSASGFMNRVPRVVCDLKNGEILLQYGKSTLVSYDPIGNRFKTLEINGQPSFFQAFPFLPSLFSAKATMDLQVSS